MNERLRVVMTAGGTHEPVDDVRHMSNVATGALPAAMAEALLRHGALVHYIHGPDAILPGRLRLDLALDGSQAPDDPSLDTLLAEFGRAARTARELWATGRLVLHGVGSAAETAQVVQDVVGAQHPHLVACAMAVADFTPLRHRGKLSSQQDGDGGLTLHMQPTAKVIDSVLAAWPEAALLGFKLLSGASEAEHRHAVLELCRRSGARWVFSNDMVDYRQGRRRGILWSAEGEALDRLSGGEGEAGRRQLGEEIVAAVLRYLDGAAGATGGGER